MDKSETSELGTLVGECWDATKGCCPTSADSAASPCCGEAAEDAAEVTPDEVRRAVRARYAEVSESGGCCGDDATTASCCDADSSAACGTREPATARDVSERLGYSPEELASVPEGANMGLGCGNPQTIAGLRSGETVVDLGSGGGLDCFLAAHQVGSEGHVIGVDMTPEMISKARAAAEAEGHSNVEFRLGEIEHLPVADDSVDVIISNCVVNLSPDKPAVYRDAFRALRPGGRVAISDVVRRAEAQFPDDIQNDLTLIGGCLAGAASVGEVETMLREAGFADVRVRSEDESREFIREWAPGTEIQDYIVSATIEAVKPGA